MITLYQPPSSWGLPSISPFGVKLETYLRMAKIEYEVRDPNIREAPNGRVPYIKMNGKIEGDSSLIIKKLKTSYGDSVDAHLTDELVARGISLQRLTEDHLYFAGAYLRWLDEKSWPHVYDYFSALMPKGIGGFIVRQIRKGMLKEIRIQGMGEHSTQAIIDFAKEDLTSLSFCLGNQPFFLGDQPTSFDACIYGMLIHQIWVPWESPVKQHGLSLKNLTGFCDRMKQRYWT
jgi:glutathione S-transferase